MAFDLTGRAFENLRDDGERTFHIVEADGGFYARANDGNIGFGMSEAEAIADLQLSYDDADFDVDNFEVFDIVFSADDGTEE